MSSTPDARGETPAAAREHRMTTGLPGFDEIVGGGLLTGGVYIVQGTPGAGKTIFANQVCFHRAAHGGRAVYVTMLSESHARMFAHLRSFEFFRDAAIPERVCYVSAFEALTTGGLEGVLALLREELRRRRAGVLVLDGLVMAASAAESEEALKLFVSDIQSHAGLAGCTTLLLASADENRRVSAEQTMVDGIFVLRERAYGARRERNLEVIKFRGSDSLRGNHEFRISAEGISVFPRLEAARRSSPGGAVLVETIFTGIEGLDAMFGRPGLRRGSITAIGGYAGTGKTTLALHFISRCSEQELGLWFSFYESPEFLLDIADALRLPLRALQRSGAVRFAWQTYGERGLDELAYRVLDAVGESGIKRLVLDGIGGFLATPSFGERGGPFFASFANELRLAGATTWITVEDTRAARDSPPLSTPTMSALCDNMLRLHNAGAPGASHGVAMVKVRGARYETAVREAVLTANGVRIDRREGTREPPSSNDVE